MTEQVYYRLLSPTEIKELDKTVMRGNYIISHVGDGEYSCNVFGNLFSSYSKALAIAQKSNPEYVMYRRIHNGTEIYNPYIGLKIGKWVSDYACLTLETLDTDFSEGA